MSVFADAYSRYLTYNFNYVTRSKMFRKYFRTSVLSMLEQEYMIKDFIDKINNFPKYPYFFHMFKDTNSIDLVKIYNSSLDNTSELVNSMVGTTQLSKKVLYDNIPTLIDVFLEELCFQFSFISKTTDLYNYNLIIRPFVSEYQYRNFFSDLYDKLFYSSDQIEGDTAGLENKAFSFEFILYIYLYNVISTTHDIFMKLLLYLSYVNSVGLESDRVDVSMMEADLQLFIDEYHSDMSTSLAYIVGQSIYNYRNISPVMLQNLRNVIDNKLTDSSSGLHNAFSQLMNFTNALDPVESIVSNVTNQLNAFIANDVASRIFMNSSIIDQQMLDYETAFEDDIFSKYIKKIKFFDLKNYLFLSFLYKFWPIKFLNILQLSLKDYVEEYIKPPDDNSRTIDEYTNMFIHFCNNGIDFSELKTFLNSNIVPTSEIITYPTDTIALFTFTPGSSIVYCSNIESFNSVNVHEYIYASGDDRSCAGHIISKDVNTLTLILNDEYTGIVSDPNTPAYKYVFDTTTYLYKIATNYNIAEFGCLMYYDFVLNAFFDSKYYKEFVEDLTETIFIYLRDSGHIDYSFDWYAYHDIITIYFKTYMRWRLLDVSSRYILSDFSSARAKFTNNSTYIKCANIDSYNIISDGDYIFAKEDTIDNSVQVIAHVDPINYIIQLSSPYTGTTTTPELTTDVYKYNTSSSTLFQNVSNNFINKIFTKILCNSTISTDYDINILIPPANTLQSRLLSLQTSKTLVRCSHQFTENLYLSTLTREIIYSMLTEFVSTVT